ncbi:hypothetical protein [Halioxenophilus aromaticivorans]|uniref:hypothetical protein n=1 Tax=Halioxenophilus aromaticivorans TaxID=1306992 RepID=UPI0031F11B82
MSIELVCFFVKTFYRYLYEGLVVSQSWSRLIGCVFESILDLFGALILLAADFALSVNFVAVNKKDIVDANCGIASECFQLVLIWCK